MGDLLPRESKAAGAEQRNAPRFTVLIRAAKLVCSAGEFLCVIRDVSQTGLSARIFHPLPAFTTVMIELQNGDRYEAELMWQEAGRAGFRFLQPVDVVRLVEVPSRFARRAIRLNLVAPAEIIASLEATPVIIHDISQQGAKIEVAQQFSIDQRVTLRGKGLRETSAKVRWRREGQCGLIFEETFQFGELARIVTGLQGYPAE